MSREQMKARLEAATHGPWFREYSDVITTDPDPRDVEEGYDDPRSLRIVRAAPHLHKREPQGIKNADFIAHAPTDFAKLHAALDAVEALHKPKMVGLHPGYGEEVICRECGRYWPCPTIESIRDALGEDQ